MPNRLLSLLALILCLASGLSFAQEPASSPSPAAAAEVPAAAATPAIETPAAPATAVTEPSAEEAAATAPTFNEGNIAWMLTSTAFVLLMSLPGLALFYGGMVRSKNMLSTMTQTFAIFCLIGVLWVVYGYSVAFSGTDAFVGTLDKMFLKGVVRRQ